MPERQWFCELAALSDPGSKGGTLQQEGGELEVLLVRRGDEVFAYQNRCPHTGVNLEWQPDRFLDLTNRYIQCATHGALFRLTDGVITSYSIHYTKLYDRCQGWKAVHFQGGSIAVTGDQGYPPGTRAAGWQR